ncbi:MAG: PTS sugar transporter subunit IIB [Gemmatimonadota bacterium]|jgi:mannose/fructose/N-acetylgalactosamine-specific phosphotransferase system component IIB
MSLDLFRIDERLLHGQVIVGWGMWLRLDHYVVVDDALAESEWERELYASGLPRGVMVEFLGVREAIAGFARLDARPGRGCLLVREPATMRRLAEAGLLEGRTVNVGGMHAGAGRSRALPYVHLTEEHFEDLETIERSGARVSARDLPSSREVSLEELARAAD